jgi:hypothetical protein
MPQLQHNMWVAAARTAVLSVITSGGKWVEIANHADPLYQHLIVTAGPKPRIEAFRIVDMGLEFLGGICRPIPQHPTSLSRP